MDKERNEELELKGLILEIYSYLLKENRPFALSENPFSKGIHEVKYNLEKLERIGLVERNVQGQYLVVEGKVRNTLLNYMLQLNKVTLRRYCFYSAFLFTSFVLFIVYVFFLPQTHFTTKMYALSLSIFSILLVVIELFKETRKKDWIKGILTKQS